jgi:predicted O-methyltransferase YrrM
MREVARGTTVAADRNVAQGYERGWGLQFGPLRHELVNEPLYKEAEALIAGRSVVSLDNRLNIYLLLTRYLKHVPPGNIVEFGAWKGGNAIFMAHVAKRCLPGTKVVALDTFAGMPETNPAIDLHRAGDFADVDLDQLRTYVKGIGLDNISFVKGLFQDTFESVREDFAPFSLAHIDCDIYSAVAFAYDAVRPWVVPGGYLVFDDALYSSCLGASEAVESLLIRRDGLNSEQVFPHFVFRNPGAAA